MTNASNPSHRRAWLYADRTREQTMFRSRNAAASNSVVLDAIAARAGELLVTMPHACKKRRLVESLERARH